MTKEFLNDVKALLTPDGIVVANTFASSRLYDHESVTYTEVFGQFMNLKMPGSGNRVVVAGKNELPSQELLRAQADYLKPRLDLYGVDLPLLVPYISRTADWNTSARSLTDQYAPANLLQGKK